MSQPLLQFEGLVKHYTVTRKAGLRSYHEQVRAVDGIDLRIDVGETLGLVGESGCGKSTAGRSILRLIEPTAGRVTFEGIDLSNLSEGDLRPLRRDISIVFQDPMSALDPRMMVGDIVSEPLRAHQLVRTRAQGIERARQLLEQVGLDPEFVNRFPHEFSGGQRQRIGIARAIATDPKLLILDEPISALDISVRAQILNLLGDLQRQRGLSYLLIAHDLSVVRHVCDRVAVMYLGVIVEQGATDSLFTNPAHPYTRALLASIPSPDPAKRIAVPALQGDADSHMAVPTGCRFRARCPLAQSICETDVPPAQNISQLHTAACHFALQPPTA